ncbi:MAG TPA: ABC transporter permease [Mucilaginibacter sp.]|jgi:putative ABC transport system permease protein|nr:ABC transporter permease [Mucilaginibacter sp.]
MIRNYIKTALRSLLKNKGFTAINIFGLALGLSICLLIVYYVADELSYDRFNSKSEGIFRVNTEFKFGGTVSSFAISAPAVGEGLVNSFPQVENSVRINQAINIRFKKGSEVIEEKKTVYCEPSIFSIFTLPMIYGDPKTALQAPADIVISESAAKKYFDKTDVVGQTLFMTTDSSVHKITGVIRDMPAQSHFHADFFMTMGPNDHHWLNFINNTYILLRPGVNYKGLEEKFTALMQKRMNSSTFNYDRFAKKGSYIKLSLTPLTDIHLHSNRQRELEPNSDIRYVYIFSIVAVFVLILACVNFINLSIARSASRAREVGIRKVLGSLRRHLIAQFLSESIIVTLAGALLAVLFAWIMLPLFNQMSGKSLTVTSHTFIYLLPALLAVVLIVGVVAGSYPAFFLSAFQPVNVLKGKLSVGFKGGFMRNTLVVFQFSISIFLIVGTLVIYNQLNYIQNKDLGFNRNQVLIIKNAHALKNPKILQQEIKQISGVVDASLTSYLPTTSSRWPNNITMGTNKSVQTEFWQVDEDYLATMGIKLKEGRNFSSEMRTDSTAIILNETAAKMLGYNGDPTVKFYFGNKEYHAVGIVKDFNFSSLRDNVTPVVLVNESDWMSSLDVKMNTANLNSMMAQIENKWRAFAPDQHMEYSFMDDEFNTMYNAERRMGQLSITFTTLAIIIACLGLFSLAAYAAEQRTKEIGIRKVLGASVRAITAMLSKDFIKLVAISIIIAGPLAWFAMNKWLQGFAYRQYIRWWVLASAAVAAIVIAFITISFQSIRAALANPVDSLRSE